MTLDLTVAFNAQRAHLLGIAYRMLGEMAAAEDVVQEAWLRWQRAAGQDIQNPRAWLSAVTVRLALDALRSVRRRRESYVGPWLPEPIRPDDLRAFTADTPAAHAELASDLSLALLHVLERLSPEERAALILHDAFDCAYDEIAATLGKSEPACRKLVSRARERVKADRPRYAVTDEQHNTLLMRFAQASTAGDAEALTPLLAPDAIVYTDGGGRVKAALKPIYGADKSTRFIVGLTRRYYSDTLAQAEVIELNGHLGLVIRAGGAVLAALTIDTDGHRVKTIYIIRNPEKLARLTATLPDLPTDRTDC